MSTGHHSPTISHPFMWKRLLIRSLFLIIEAFVLYYYGFLKAGLSIYLGLMQEHVVYFET